jgi:hypothetical protein
MAELQKSPNWDRRKDIVTFFNIGPPYNEGLPRCGPSDNKLFEIIMRDGQRHHAEIDFSKQHESEGLQWCTLSGKLIHEHTVIAWCEVEQKE